MTPPVIATVLLAAGKSSRFGANKLYQSLPNGLTVLESAIQPYLGATDSLTLVVSQIDDLNAKLANQYALQLLVANDANLGMGHSLAAGVRAMQYADGWIIGLGDMPLLQPASVAAVAMALSAGSALVTLAHQAQRGHPVGFSKVHGAALMAAQGDVGAKHILKAHADTAVVIETDDAGILIDVDRPSDWIGLGTN